MKQLFELLSTPYGLLLTFSFIYVSGISFSIGVSTGFSIVDWLNKKIS